VFFLKRFGFGFGFGWNCPAAAKSQDFGHNEPEFTVSLRKIDPL
jgi:hypothetical protein